MDKLKYENQWEADEYTNSATGQVIEKLRKVLIAGCEYKVRSERIAVECADMGNTYETVSTHFYITVEIFGGVKHEIDLNTVVNKVPVYIVAAKYEKS